MKSFASSCPHLAEALDGKTLSGTILEKYKSVVAWNVHRSQRVKNSAKRRKVATPTCGTCELTLSRPFSCLHCSYSGCWSENHMFTHLKDHEHSYCADVKSGSVFCVECNDFIYDSNLEEIFLSAVVMAEEKQTRSRAEQIPRQTYKPWVPSDKETGALERSTTLPCQGRRGLLNLGQTCFLNVVLQCLVHNPLLRHFFLGDKHNSKQCSKADQCSCCEMDKLFTEIYSEDSNPYGPISFLATTWRATADLSGYAQQDAHEFFIAALNQIHSTSRGSTNVSCNCIIHTTFAGQLQSDVKCERCGNVTNTVDPMLDISLELKGKTGETSAENTLAACLRRFTQPEKLGPKEYSCAKCGKASHEASKRLSIKTLPPVLSFQFKRFEHKTSDKSTARKIDAPIRFPASLNMAPYTTTALKDTEKGNSGFVFSYPGSQEYDLFAVINHEGQIDNGHYTNFARFQDEWYRFDDDKVAVSSLGACLSSVAYMCFYVKRNLDYKPHVTPSYVKSREQEAIREREQENLTLAARMKEVEDALLATV